MILFFSWIQFLEKLTVLVGNPMNPANMQTMFSLITISVHCRDVINELVLNKVSTNTDFTWRKHLRYEWDAQVRALN